MSGTGCGQLACIDCVVAASFMSANSACLLWQPKAKKMQFKCTVLKALVRGPISPSLALSACPFARANAEYVRPGDGSLRVRLHQIYGGH